MRLANLHGGGRFAGAWSHSEHSPVILLPQPAVISAGPTRLARQYNTRRVVGGLLELDAKANTHQPPCFPSQP